MRVIAGKARSLQLKTPKGLNTRPTLDRIKETLFNILQNDIPGCVFVDLFAGSGAIGIEALSRGAIKAYFIDNNKEAIGCINDNLLFTHLNEDAVVLSGDFLSSLHMINENHIDIIFADPPYEALYEDKILDILYNLKGVDENTIIIIEAKIDNKINNNNYEIIKEKIYKTNKHIFLRRK